jgi:hypothetical protein
MVQQWGRRQTLQAGGAIGMLGLAGCLDASSPDSQTVDEPLSVTAAKQFNSPGCGCCEQYASYLRENITGSLSETVPDDIQAVKQEHGIPEDLQSCHTITLDEYVIEGHIPAEAIAKLLDETPSIDGIALPGMPRGSPGMGGKKDGSFLIYAIGGDQTGTEYTKI